MHKSILTLILFLAAIHLSAQKPNVQKAFKTAARQTELLLAETAKAPKGEKNDLVSPRTVQNGELKLIRSGDWTSGFFAGILWQYYQFTRDEKWMKAAMQYTALQEKEQYNTSTHDLGFMIYCSFGNGYKLTKNEEYRKVIIQAAKSLCKRFNEKAGVIRSWDHNGDKWKFPVIVDNMMNLELLFAATRFTGDSSYDNLAVTHANTTLKNHYRPDFSSYHVVDYDPESGAIRGKVTAQGYSAESAWARGQAWGLYGFILCYRETKNEVYLKQAEGIARFILTHKNLPADLVPYWDYNDPLIPEAPRDASAAAITASALYELSTYGKNNKEYKNTANRILHSLSTRYVSKPGSNKGFILDHSTGHKPANSEIDVPIIYADYYYLEALLRSQDLNSAKK